MDYKQKLWLIIALCTFAIGFSQQPQLVATPLELEIKPVDSLPFDKTLMEPSLVPPTVLRLSPRRWQWKKVNKIGLDVNEVAFVNWNAGGANAISGLLKTEFKRIYETNKLRWNNELKARYGLNEQKGRELQKTDDHLEFNSTVGYRRDSSSAWFYSAKFNFSTQISNGYKYPDTDNKISTFMAPAYWYLGLGTEYGKKIKSFTLYLSPLTLKSTFVLDQELANSGAFGVKAAVKDADGNIIKRGRNSRTELGALITNEYNTEIFNNIKLKHKISLYTDYLNNFGNIDINWELSFNFKVNKYVLASIGSHLKYDDDVKIQKKNDAGEMVDAGSRVQWKQQLGIGVLLAL
ncbi:MAG: DUF3078 domain-containing protein [Mesonia hippocampi]|uniref:DUF3078 domain-containing protein n=1 Tax=Mesonia hippocampi TaxID=1628250 RepID=UPI003F9B4027